MQLTQSFSTSIEYSFFEGSTLECDISTTHYNKNGLTLFNFDDITVFKVFVMSPDPKTESGAERVQKVKQKKQ
jgi:hypothetical protein